MARLRVSTEQMGSASTPEKMVKEGWGAVGEK